MTSSELAILALGLLLGAAVGSALVVTFGNRPSRREIRVTVTRDAVRRRSDTLSQDAFMNGSTGPAPGGPGDRRGIDRDEAGVWPEPAPWQPVIAPAGGLARATGHVPMVARDRTFVPSFSVARARAASAPVATPVAVAIEPEIDRELEDLRRRPAHGTQLERMLRGDHRAMVEVVDAIAGEDSRQRRSWELLLGGLVEAMADIAVRESVIDLPMGTAFWDMFTVEQCRRIVAALGSMGYRYDGVAGWTDSRVPAYVDLTRALADAGVEPRRQRTWPNQGEIATLFVGARPAPDELLPAAGPDYAAADMQALLGDRAAALGDLWTTWEAIRPTLFAETVLAEAAAGR